MSLVVNRRELLQALTFGAVLPFQQIAPPRRRSVGIIGGGMAGVSTAWLLDGARDVVLLEARNAIGGNVQGVTVELDGHQFVVDIGAQYFHPGPYPVYTSLLTHLGLHRPDMPQLGKTHSFPASITLAATGEPTPRFVSPVLPDRWWPLFAPWNLEGVWAFLVGFLAAKSREDLNESWSLTLGEWLPTLGLSQHQWEGMLLPWAASLFSGDIEQARGMSARAAMIFAAKALPPNLLDPLLYYVLNDGMGVVLDKMVSQCSTVTVLTSKPVQRVSREPHGGFRLLGDSGPPVVVDDLVLASSGPATIRLLERVPGTASQTAALGRIEFHEARLALHTDPIYAPADPALWSFFNAAIDGGSCEASMWLGPVLSGAPPATAAKVWKSWVTHRFQQPSEVLHETSFRHMLPTPASILGQNQVATLQGLDGIWFAGGYLSPYDSQETALRSALRIAAAMNVSSSRSQTLIAALNGAPL